MHTIVLFWVHLIIQMNISNKRWINASTIADCTTICFILNQPVIWSNSCRLFPVRAVSSIVGIDLLVCQPLQISRATARFQSFEHIAQPSSMADYKKKAKTKRIVQDGRSSSTITLHTFCVQQQIASCYLTDKHLPVNKLEILEWIPIHLEVEHRQSVPC